MSQARAAVAHEIPDRSPLEVAPGDLVEVGERDTTWTAFVYVMCERGEGWVPARHLAEEGGRMVVLASYDTTELATSVGELLEIVERDDESGWLWCRSERGEEGWVPADTLELRPT